MNADALFATLPTLSAQIMHQTVTGELNVGWDSFCRASRINPIRLDDSSELLAQDELRLQEGFASLTVSRADLWFDVGLRYRSLKYGALGLAMMTARTLAEALEIADRYQALTYSLVKYRYASAPDGACVLIGDTTDVPAAMHDFTQYRDLGAIRTLIADLMAGEPVLDRVRVAAPPPGNWESIKQHFSCPVEFHADQTRWIFVRGAASRHLPLSDFGLETLYSSHCNKQLVHVNDAPLTYRLTALLSAKGEGFLSAGEAAKRLAVSERTLHRRLRDEGTHFSSVIDEARYRRARELLADKRKTIEMIAYSVGFAEPSSFSRAFKRWSGMGALEFRQRMLR